MTPAVKEMGMFRKKYELKAVFLDEDYGNAGYSKKYWSRLAANYDWYVAEKDRLNKPGTDEWKFVVIHLPNNKDVTPNYSFPNV